MKRIIFTLMVTTGFTLLNAQDLSAEDKAKAEKEIIAEVEARIKEIVTPLVVAEKLKMEFPPSAPSEAVESLDKRVNESVMAQVDEKYPLSTRDKHLKVAVQKYILYKEGDMVKDLRIRPAGRMAVVSGEFKGYSRSGELKIGSYEVPKVDMKEDVMVHFVPELNKKKIETYIKNKMFYFEGDRKTMQAELTPKIKKEYYTAAGYYQSGDDYYPAVEFLKKSYEEEKKRVAETIYKEVSGEILAKYNLKSSASLADKGAKPVEDKKGEDPFEEPKETTKPEPKKEAGSGVRKRIPLFDPGFYDPEF